MNKLDNYNANETGIQYLEIFIKYVSSDRASLIYCYHPSKYCIVSYVSSVQFSANTYSICIMYVYVINYKKIIILIVIIHFSYIYIYIYYLPFDHVVCKTLY